MPALPACEHVGKAYDMTEIEEMLANRGKAYARDERQKQKMEWGEEDDDDDDDDGCSSSDEGESCGSQDWVMGFETGSGSSLYGQQRDPNTTEPVWELEVSDDFIRVRALLPGVMSAADIDAEIIEGSTLVLVAKSLELRAALPTQVDTEVMNCAFDVARQVVTLVFLVEQDEEGEDVDHEDDDEETVSDATDTTGITVKPDFRKSSR